MKKITTLVLAASALLFYGTAAAQLYVRAGAGYALPFAGQTYTDQQISLNISSYSGYTVKSFSYSAGVQGTASVGYMLNRHVGFQVDAAIGIANKQYAYKENGNFAGISYMQVTTSADHTIIIMPSLVLQTGGEVWSVYCRTGPALPANTKITRELAFVQTQSTGTDAIYEKVRYSNNFSLGYATATGVSYNWGGRASLWCELNVLSLSENAKKEELETYIKNGQNIPLTQFSSTIHYFDKNGGSTNSPTFSQPLSNIGLTAGLKINLTQKRTKYL